MWIFFLILCSSNAFFWNWWSSQAFGFFSLLLFPYIFHLSAPPVYGSSSVHGTVPPHSKAIHLKILSQLWRFGPNVLWQCVFSPKLHCHSVLSWLSVLVTWLTPNPGRIAQNSGIHREHREHFVLSFSSYHPPILIFPSFFFCLFVLYISLSRLTLSELREREREREICGLKCQKVKGFPAKQLHRLQDNSTTHSNTHTYTKVYINIIQACSLPPQKKYNFHMSNHAHTFLLATCHSYGGLQYSHTHMQCSGQVVFPSKLLCALQSSKMIFRSTVSRLWWV